MKMICSLLLACCSALTVFAQQSTLNIAGIHQLVNASSTEHDRQVEARDQQALAAANEKANLTLLSKFKNVYRDLQQRYNTLGTAIDLAGIGMYGYPMLSRTISNQSRIIELTRGDPALVAIGYQSELRFAQKAESLIRYVTGLSLSYGDINQMKASDRKLLFDHALTELSILQDLSGNMVRMMESASLSGLLRSAGPFRDHVNADKALAVEIIRNAKYLKR